MEDPITARGIVTADEYIASFEAHFRHNSTPILRFGKWFFFGLLILMTTLPLVVLFGDSHPAKKREALPPMTATIAALWGLWLWKTRAWRVAIRKGVRAVPEADRLTEWVLDEDKFEARNSLSNIRFLWSVFKKIVEAPVGFLLYQDDLSFILIPSHAFASAGELTRFVNLARSQVANYVVVGECRHVGKPEPLDPDEI